MPSPEIHSPYANPGIPERYETIRSAVQRMEPDDVARQLPNLIELIRTHSGNDEPTVRFVIGISFTQNETLFDYRLDRIVEIDESGQRRYETVKPPVNENHLYLVFAYPSDPHFDAATLRGALLTAIEDEAISTRSPSSGNDDNPSAVDHQSVLGKVLRQLGLDTLWVSTSP